MSQPADPENISRPNEDLANMRIKILAGLVGLVLMSATAEGAPQITRIGRWEVTREADRFGGPAKVIALLTNNDGSMLAIRCL